MSRLTKSAASLDPKGVIIAIAIVGSSVAGAIYGANLKSTQQKEIVSSPRKPFCSSIYWPACL